MGGVLADCRDPKVLSTSGDGETKIIIRVGHALIHDTLGANVSGFKVGDQITISSLRKARGLEALGWRYRSDVKALWPPSYRFQAPRHNLMAEVLSRDGRTTQCVVQVPVEADDRSMENAQRHVEDAEIATSHARRFNEQMSQSLGNMMDVHDPGEAPPALKICAPVACEVVSSSAPEILPRGSACTVTPYPHSEVVKYVFNGADDFMEVAQSFFHFAAFASGGSEFVCDLQGAEHENGEVHLIDPIVLREEKPGVTGFLSTMTSTQQAPPRKLDIGPEYAPTGERFDRLHPKCGQICQTFDPMRRGAKGKKGVCGITCMT